MTDLSIACGSEVMIFLCPDICVPDKIVQKTEKHPDKTSLIICVPKILLSFKIFELVNLHNNIFDSFLNENLCNLSGLKSFFVTFS